jgi:hypothetical protein
MLPAPIYEVSSESVSETSVESKRHLRKDPSLPLRMTCRVRSFASVQDDVVFAFDQDDVQGEILRFRFTFKPRYGTGRMT